MKEFIHRKQVETVLVDAYMVAMAHIRVFFDIDQHGDVSVWVDSEGADWDLCDRILHAELEKELNAENNLSAEVAAMRYAMKKVLSIQGDSKIKELSDRFENHDIQFS